MTSLRQIAAAAGLALLLLGGRAEAAGPFESAAGLDPRNPIDQRVLARLQRAGITPAPLCSDAVFVRRVFLDVLGVLPTGREAREFIGDPAPGKRRVLIDRLLNRDEYADYWAMKWGDALRVKSEFPINLWPNAAQAYHRWIRAAVKENRPYDQFARELLTASGSNFRNPPVNFYRALQNKTPAGIAQAAALTFLGARAERWPKERWDGLAGFFSNVVYKATGEWKEEIVLFEPGEAPAPAAVFPDGVPARIQPGQDPREVFAAWLTAPGNPGFARCMANRAWAWLEGRGIIHEPDDIRPDNPPSNPELLAWLEARLVESRFDLKALFRVILNSGVYQLSSIPASSQLDTESLFGCYPLRRLEAEVLMDALCQITGTTEKYSSAIPEPFTFMPEDQRTVALPDGSITSSFLEMFGRPARDTGMDSERNNRPTTSQRLHLLNSSHIQRKIEQSAKLQAIIQSRATSAQITTALYLTILSRYPTAREEEVLAAHARAGALSGRERALDLAWALVNSAEFLHRH